MLDNMKKLWKLQSEARRIQKELRRYEIKSEGANGKIIVTFSGEQKLDSLHIDEELLSPDNKKYLEREIKSAFDAGLKEAQKVAASKMKSITGDLGIPGM
jgi:DNA-binding YbaB/EbfC family protein